MKGEQRFDFVITLSRLMALLLDIVTELVFAHNLERHRYWRKEGMGWVFEPDEETLKWMKAFAPQAEVPESNVSTIVPDVADTDQDSGTSRLGKEDGSR